MRRLLGLVLLLTVASCAAPQSAAVGDGGSPMIDVPEPPFPYNSRWW